MKESLLSRELNEEQIFAIKNRLTAIMLNNEILQRNISLGKIDQEMLEARLQKNQDEIQKVNFMMDVFQQQLYSTPKHDNELSYFNVIDLLEELPGSSIDVSSPIMVHWVKKEMQAFFEAIIKEASSKGPIAIKVTNGGGFVYFEFRMNLKLQHIEKTNRSLWEKLLVVLASHEGEILCKSQTISFPVRSKGFIRILK